MCGEHPVWLQQLDDEVSDSGLLVRPSSPDLVCPGFGSAARVVVRIAQFRISRMVSRSRSWRGPSARKFGRRSSGRAKHEKGAPAFDAVLDEQAQRDQMHDRRLPGTPFGPIPGMLGRVAVHHSAAPPGRSDAGQRVDLDLTEYPQHPGAEGT